MRELFHRFRIHLIIGSLLLCAFFLYSWHLRAQGATTLLERSVLAVAAPVNALIDGALGGISSLWNRYLHLIDTEQENRLLRDENAHLRGELLGLEEVRLANIRLRELLAFRETVDMPALPAQVIGEELSPWFRTAMIDKGSEEGLYEGAPVVVAEGVVGRIIKVGPHQSRVLLLTDASSAVAALVQKNRTRGICRGNGEDLHFNFVLRRDEVAIGDRIVTSGLGGLFPKGLVLGEVVYIESQGFGLFQSIVVQPSVDFSRLEEVLVLLPGPM